MADKRNEIKKQIKAKISLLEKVFIFNKLFLFFILSILSLFKGLKIRDRKNCDDINFCNYEGYNGDTEYEFCDHLEDSVSLGLFS